MLVKICGITRPEDAEAAVRYGATALGFVFWPSSPRAIDPFRARAIARVVPPFVTIVGVFVNQPAEFVNEVSSLVGLGAVQLHGDEPPSVAQRVRRPIVKAVSLRTPDVESTWSLPVMLLVDADDPVRRGGTGARADWSAAAALARRRPIVLAGGLTPDNVREAVDRVRPYGVDVSSGVESRPGVKDHQQLARFFAQLQVRSERQM